MTEYPHDQFDDVPEYRDRKGSHRAVVDLSTGPSGLTWISIAAALALVIGAFCYFILPTLRPSGMAGTAGAMPAASAPATAPASPVATAGTTGPGGGPPAEGAGEADDDTGRTPGAQQSPGPGQTQEPEQAEEPAEEPSDDPAQATETPAVVDRTLPVEVYNASRVNGLAGRTGASLSSAGFNVVATGNWAGFPVSGSAVFYATDEATAQAVAGRLGLPAVHDARVPAIAVVVTAEYAG